MLIDLGMGMKYWDKLVQIANYLQNQSPVAYINMTPYKVGTGVKSKLKHL